jgi:hypothetical protein
VLARATLHPPPHEDWRTVPDLMHVAGVSRAQAYRLLWRGVVPSKVFGRVRYIRAEDVTTFVRGKSGDRKRSQGWAPPPA